MDEFLQTHTPKTLTEFVGNHDVIQSVREYLTILPVSDILLVHSHSGIGTRRSLLLLSEETNVDLQFFYCDSDAVVNSIVELMTKQESILYFLSAKRTVIVIILEDWYNRIYDVFLSLSVTNRKHVIIIDYYNMIKTIRKHVRIIRYVKPPRNDILALYKRISPSTPMDIIERMIDNTFGDIRQGIITLYFVIRDSTFVTYKDYCTEYVPEKMLYNIKLCLDTHDEERVNDLLRENALLCSTLYENIDYLMPELSDIEQFIDTYSFYDSYMSSIYCDMYEDNVYLKRVCIVDPCQRIPHKTFERFKNLKKIRKARRLRRTTKLSYSV